MGLTALVVGWVGSVIGTTGIAGAISTVIGTAISGAIIGAAVGGLTAAVTGGDIGKGMLNGALGGAVMGGLSGAWQVFKAGGTVAYASASGQTVQSAGTGADAVAANEAVASKFNLSLDQLEALNVGKDVTLGSGQGAAGALSGETKQVLGKTVAGAAEGLLKKDSTDPLEQIEKQGNIEMALLNRRGELDAAESEKTRAGRMMELEKQLQSQLAIDKQGIDEQRRQFDVGSAAALAKQRDAAKTRGVLTTGEGTETEAMYDPDLTYELLQTGQVA